MPLDPASTPAALLSSCNRTRVHSGPLGPEMSPHLFLGLPKAKVRGTYNWATLANTMKRSAKQAPAVTEHRALQPRRREDRGAVPANPA